MEKNIKKECLCVCVCIWITLHSWNEHNVVNQLQFKKRGTSLPIQWLRLHAFAAGGMDLNPGGELDLTCQAQPREKKKKRIAQTQALKGSDDNIFTVFANYWLLKILIPAMSKNMMALNKWCATFSHVFLYFLFSRQHLMLLDQGWQTCPQCVGVSVWLWDDSVCLLLKCSFYPRWNKIAHKRAFRLSLCFVKGPDSLLLARKDVGKHCQSKMSWTYNDLSWDKSNINIKWSSCGVKEAQENMFQPALF